MEYKALSLLGTTPSLEFPSNAQSLFFAAQKLTSHMASSRSVVPPIPPSASNDQPLLMDDGNTHKLLLAILLEIGAPEYLQNFIDKDQDDDCLASLGVTRPDKISKAYGLPLNVASAFVERCRVVTGVVLGNGSTISTLSSVSSVSSIESYSSVGPHRHSPPPTLDVASLLLKLNLEITSELGKGGFGTVYKCKNLADKLTVAVKLVNDPKNAKEAMREGQRLRRVKHKNIVLMHRVHDLNPILGNGTCALEMEAVAGGDLHQHIEAARSRPELRLPHEAVIRFSRQLLEALIYLHEDIRWLHGDIKPQNILMQCSPVPADGSPIDYTNAEIKLADFGLVKIMDQQSSGATFMLSNASTKAGVIKGTLWYMSPEALQGASKGYQRTFTDDLWSACLVIYEMDTGLPLQELLTSPGAVRLDDLLTKASPEFLPLLCSVLAPDAASRCSSARELLIQLDASFDPMFQWQMYDSSQHCFVPVHQACAFVLERALSANEPQASLSLQPPLDMNFSLCDILHSSSALGLQTQRKSGVSAPIRRLLRSSASTDIPLWQRLVDGKEWIQCEPASSAKLDMDARNSSILPDATKFRHLLLQPGCIGSGQLRFPVTREPYLEPAHADDVAILSKRVHDSLPEWDITEALQIINPSLSSKYAAYRHRIAARCNGNPNERTVFHLAPDFVIPKIWQAGEGFESRLAQWSEIGRGAYFCEHVIYSFAYKYGLWVQPDCFKVVAEPPVGETMRVFAVLVCLGKVADMGPGCESCPSPAFNEWKNEYAYQKSAQNPNPLPTRPPAIPLPSDLAERQHLLDLNQVKDEPRYDSVLSTEGELATHPDSTCATPAGKHMRDVMHPRMKAGAKEWGKQYVLFDTSASYPMILLTLTKTRESHMGPQQLMDAGCDAARMKALGFTVLELKQAGCSVRQLKDGGFAIDDLLSASYDLPALIAGGYSVGQLRSAGFTALQLKDAGCSAQQLFGAKFSAAELQAANVELGQFYAIISVSSATPQALALARAYYSDIKIAYELCSEFAAAESSNPKLSTHLAHACKILELFVAHNAFLQFSNSSRQAAPLPEALIRFELPLLRLTTQYLVTKKWFPRFYVLRGSRLYYSSNGGSDRADAESRKSTLDFMQSQPVADGRYCIDLKGWRARCVFQSRD